MNNILLIFIGAGLGGVLRFLVSESVHLFFNKNFPYGTLIVNISGSLLMGILFVLIIEKFHDLGPHLRALLLIGLLGGYTTFSSFSLETIHLLEQGQWMHASLNVILSTVLCIGATWGGLLFARIIFI